MANPIRFFQIRYVLNSNLPYHLERPPILKRTPTLHKRPCIMTAFQIVPGRSFDYYICKLTCFIYLTRHVAAVLPDVSMFSVFYKMLMIATGAVLDTQVQVTETSTTGLTYVTVTVTRSDECDGR